MKYSSPKTRAFTLVELLVTVAIIGVLSALILGTLSGTRQGGFQTSCASNLRVIGAAIHLYAQDNNGQLPGPAYSGQIPYYHDPSRARGFQNLCDYLSPFLDVKPATGQDEFLADVFVCPAWMAWRGRTPTSQEKVYTVPFDVPLPDGTRFTPFGYPGPTTTNPKLLPMRLVNITSPSKMAAMYDVDAVKVPSWAGSVPPKQLHFSKRNYLFFDGHVENRTDWP